MSVNYTISVSDTVIQSKEGQDHKEIWRTMHPVVISLAGLKQYVEAGHPFLCSKRKQEWDGQQLFCIDIDHFERTRGRFNFGQFIALLDALSLPPCMAYTTFHNPDRKRERFRLLFQLDKPVTDLALAKSVSRLLYGILNDLVPGAPDKACVSPYHLFYPGKKIILYRPNKVAPADIISEMARELKKPKVIIKTTWAWDKMKQILEKDPYIPSVTWGTPPPGYLIILGTEPWIVKYQEDIKTSLGILKLDLIISNRLSYNLTLWKKVIDSYYYMKGAAEQSKLFLQTGSMTVFEHYQELLSDVLSKCSYRCNCDPEQAKQILQKHKNTVYQAMGIRIKKNTSMVLPVRYTRYAKTVLNVSDYPNLSRLFQRDPRKQQVLACIALLARDYAVREDVSKNVPQYIITHQMIAGKLQKKFHQRISSDCLTEWLRQFHDLQLVHLCKDNEIRKFIKASCPSSGKRPTVIQVPYFDRSVLDHAEILAANYKPPLKTAHTESYTSTKNILAALLLKDGYFTRSSFLACIRNENEAGNTDGYTIENAATYFDRYVPQIQQELGLTKSSCTKELMARFPGNHKIGLTKLYYRGEY